MSDYIPSEAENSEDNSVESFVYKAGDDEFIHEIEFNNGRKISGTIEFCFTSSKIIRLKEFTEIFKFDEIKSIKKLKHV